MGQIPLNGDHWGGMVHVRRIAALILLAVGFSLVYSGLVGTLPQQKPPSTRLDPLVSPDDSQPSESSSVPRPWTGMGARLLYPYSIIPGGARTSQELKIAIANDPVVAFNYQGFDVSQSRILRLDRDRMVYVTYRLNNHVYWTKKKLKLAKGEALISDGAHLARTRCGNRISEVPASPVSPAEPEAEAFETPADPALLAVAEPPFELPLAPPPTTGIQPSGGKILTPPIFPIWLGSGTPSTPGGIIGSPPPISTPEPDTLILLVSGIAALLLRRSHRPD